MFHRATILTVLVLLLAGIAAADTLHLKNGRAFDGRLVSETKKSVVFEIRGVGRQTFKKSEVEKQIAPKLANPFKVLQEDEGE